MNKYTDSPRPSRSNCRLVLWLATLLLGSAAVCSQASPTFVGATTNLSVYLSASATNVNGLLHASDTDANQTLTWAQYSAPAHGALAFTSATAATGNTNIAPGGAITYRPNSGYTGADSFIVQVSDGTASATRTISVNVDAVAGATGNEWPAPVNNSQPTVALTWMIAVNNA